MTHSAPSGRSSRGFTLIEILVGLTLGFIAIVVMYQVFAVFEAQRRTSTTGGDAQTNGLVGLFGIERDVRTAGYGLVYNKAVDDTTYSGQLLCTSLAYFKGGAKTISPESKVFLPVRIEDNVGPNGADRITVAFSGHPLAATPMVIAKKTPDAGSATPNMIFVTNAPSTGIVANPTIAVANDDLILVATPVPLPVPVPKEAWAPVATPPLLVNPSPAGGQYNGLRPCTLLQAKNVALGPGGTTFQIDPSGGSYNPTGGVNPYPQVAGTDYVSTMEDGYPASTASPSVVVNLGRAPGAAGTPFVWNRYSVNRVVSGGSNTERYDLVVENLVNDLFTGVSQPVTVSDNIVTLQAQYGVTDPTDVANCPSISASLNCQTVLKWVDAKSVGGEDWSNPTPGMISRIKAVRVALVARSPLVEKIDATGSGGYTGAQACTNKDTANATGVCAWVGDGTSPSPTVDLSGIANWQTYRYRVYETVIPLRNVIWGAM